MDVNEITFTYLQRNRMR